MATTTHDINTLDACKDGIIQTLVDLNKKVDRLREEISVLKGQRDSLAKQKVSLGRIWAKLEVEDV